MGPRLSSPSPLDDDDLLREIFIRLPPQPSSLPRVSLVCARWRRVLSDPHFLARFRERHGKPPLLGFFTGDVGTRHVFAPFLDPPDRIPAGRFSVPQSRDCLDFRGCRHGLAVLVNDRGREVVVWDPLTGQHRRHRVPFPPGLVSNGSKTGTSWLWHAAVMCADAQQGHVHGDCFASPFKLVLMCAGKTQAFAGAYESASGVWGNLVSTVSTHRILSRPGVVVGNAVYWLFRRGGVLEFDIERQSLAVINKPAGVHGTYCWSFQLLRTGDDDGSLGLAVLSKLCIHLWKRQSNSNNGVVEWVRLQKIIQLDGLFLQKMHCGLNVALMVGYDEDSNGIVLATDIGVFMLQIESVQFTTVCKAYTRDSKIFYPYRNFYTAGKEVGWKWVNLEL